MAYCTIEDLYDAMGKQSIIDYAQNDSTEEASVYEPRIDAVIENATAEIDGSLRSRYKTPLDPVPVFIKDICIKIALYNLISRKGYAKDSAEENYRKRYEDVKDELKRIQKGEIDIGIATSESTSRPAPTVLYRTKKRQFGDESMGGY